MERERIREKEPEPIEVDYSWNELRSTRQDEEKKLFNTASRVRHFANIPWSISQQANHKVFTGAQVPDTIMRLKRAPIWTLLTMIQTLRPGGRSGNHRHFSEALFYILQGKGYEIHDDKRYDWEAGDVVCVPSYCIHQHFADQSTGATMFYTARGDLCQYMGVGVREQMEVHTNFTIPLKAEPLRDTTGRLMGYRRQDGVEIQLMGNDASREVMDRKRQAAAPSEKPKNTYDEYVEQYWAESYWRQTCPHVIKTKNISWEDTRQGKIKYVVHPKVPTGLLTYDCFLQEIPPGGRSGKHRHVGEEVHFIIEGKGYDVIDGVRWDWAANDVVCIPVLSTHQHFNPDPQKPVMFLSVESRLYSFIGHGGKEHIEDASP